MVWFIWLFRRGFFLSFYFSSSFFLAFVDECVCVCVNRKAIVRFFLSQSVDITSSNWMRIVVYFGFHGNFFFFCCSNQREREKLYRYRFSTQSISQAKRKIYIIKCLSVFFLRSVCNRENKCSPLVIRGEREKNKEWDIQINKL